MDPLDVLSQAFPFPDIEDEFNIDEDLEDCDEPNQVSRRSMSSPTKVLIRFIIQDAPNPKENGEHEWHQDSGFGTGSLGPNSDLDPNDVGSLGGRTGG